MTHHQILKVIQEWKFFWMNQRQHSEEDYQNYFKRAFGIDSNMKHDLADRIKKGFAEENKRLRSALEFYASRTIYEKKSVFPGDEQYIECKDIAEEALK